MLRTLIDYASDRSRWNSQFQAALSRVRGSATGARANCTSAKRRHAAFGGDDDGPAQYPSKKAAMSLPDRRTPRDIERTREMANQIVRASEARARARAEQDPASITVLEASDGGIVEGEDPVDAKASLPAQAAQRRQAREMQRMRQSFEFRLDTVQQLLLQRSLPASPGPPQLLSSPSESMPVAASLTTVGEDQPHHAVHTHSPLATTAPTDPASTVVDETADGIAIAAAVPSISPGQARTNELTFMLYLQENEPGSAVLYSAAELCACRPPTISFANDVARLFHDWYECDHIMLGSPKRGIPVRLWDQVFKKKKGAPELKAWDSIRSSWHNWKYIVEKYECLGCSEMAFWSVFTAPDGRHLKYQEILRMLKEERRVARNKLALHAEDAKRFFGGNLKSPDAKGTFMYRKSGQLVPLAKADEIGGRWLDLLAMDDSIRQRWETFQAGIVRRPGSFMEQ